MEERDPQDDELREEDVTEADALNDDVREGDGGELPGDDGYGDH